MTGVVSSNIMTARRVRSIFTRALKELAHALDVGPTKLRPLLDNLVVAGWLTREDKRYANTAEVDTFLVRGQPDYIRRKYSVWYCTNMTQPIPTLSLMPSWYSSRACMQHHNVTLTCRARVTPPRKRRPCLSKCCAPQLRIGLPGQVYNPQ